MEHRLFQVTRPRGPSAPKKSAISRRRDVLVCLGDPSLPDPIKRDGVFNPHDLEVVERVKATLGTLTEYSFRYHNRHDTLLDELRRRPPEFVLNLCDEGFNNDTALELHVPALLEMLAIPYSGAGPACLAACGSKVAVTGLARTLGIPTPHEQWVAVGETARTPEHYPVIVKPNAGAGSFGLTQYSVARTRSEFEQAVSRLRAEMPDTSLVIQEFLTGRELTVGVIGNPGKPGGMRTLPILEVDFSQLEGGLPPILSYDSKWDPDSQYWKQIHYRQAELPDALRLQLVRHAEQLFARLGCRDYARFDFRLDASGVPRLLEANPNPGWSWDCELTEMASWAGMSYADVLQFILQSALARYETKLSPAL